MVNFMLHFLTKIKSDLKNISLINNQFESRMTDMRCRGSVQVIIQEGFNTEASLKEQTFAGIGLH